MEPPAQHAGGVAGAPLDDVDVEMLRLLTGFEDALLAPPEAQLLAGGHFCAAGAGLKREWFGEGLQGALLQHAPAAQQLPSVAGAGACSTARVLQRWGAL